MKGIAHFLTGIALATCIPEVVAHAREGSLLPVLGGIAGLLPDLLDFRFVRYFERYDVVVDPGPEIAGVASDGTGAVARGAAERVVDAFVATLRVAFETGEPQRLVAHTVRCGADRWRRYTLRIDPEAREVAARIGPVVTTGRSPLPDTTPPGSAWAARHVDFPLTHDYQRQYDVDIFTGPTFTFRRERDGLHIDFLDWHHRWTHSLPLALALGVGVWLVGAQLWGPDLGRLAGLVSGVAFAAHVLEDQLGHMGCNLLWPLSRRRRHGLGWLHAADPAPNFLVVWTALALILFNLDRGGPTPPMLPGAPYLAVAVAAPWALHGLRALRRRLGGDVEDPAPADPGDAERLAELHDAADG